MTARYLFLFVSVILGGALLSPPLYLLFLQLADAWPALEFLEEYTVDRITSRLVAVGILGAFLWRPKAFGLRSPKKMGLDFKPGWKKEVAAGVAISIIVAFIGTVVLFHFDARSWDLENDFEWAEFLIDLVKALVGVAIIGFVEEYFFRGVLLRLFMRRSRFWMAACYSSLIYAAVHFFRLKDYAPPGGFHPLEGFAVMGHLLDPIARDWLGSLSSLWGLFLAGLIFCYAFFRTGRLFVSVGLHAGWVFFTKLDGNLTDHEDFGLRWLYGSGDMIDGVMIQLLVLGVAAGFVLWQRLPRMIGGESSAEKQAVRTSMTGMFSLSEEQQDESG
jgi:hypothetical protein